MKKILIEDAASATRGKLEHFGPRPSEALEKYITGVRIDSRQIETGDLYVAMKGERVDGHDFVLSSVQKGAICVLAEELNRERITGIFEQNPMVSAYVIFVENTVNALGRLAEWYRELYDGRLVAVTGSSGKTTTKDMITGVMETAFSTHKTEGNLNNLIGLPLTVFGIEKTHEVVVLEMGMDRRGEISELTRIGKPDIAVITNIGIAHIENLGTRENIFKAKAEIFEGLKKGGTAVLNGDDPYLKNVHSEDFRVIKYGLSPNCDFRAFEITHHSDGSQSFVLVGPGTHLNITVGLPGEHNIMNAMAAAICGFLFDMEAEDIQKGIQNFRPSKLRMEFFPGKNEIKVINDSYNANPDSMKAALKALKEVPGSRRYAVMGDMLELGELAESAHQEILHFIWNERIANGVLGFGPEFEKAISRWTRSEVGEEAFQQGFTVVSFPRKDEILEWVCDSLGAGDLLLIKGSRGMGMEYVADGLRS